MVLLMKNPGRVFSADEIYERVWNERAVNTDTIMVHVRNIREKIEINPKEPKYPVIIANDGNNIVIMIKNIANLCLFFNFVSNSPHHLQIFWFFRIDFNRISGIFRVLLPY